MAQAGYFSASDGTGRVLLSLRGPAPAPLPDVAVPVHQVRVDRLPHLLRRALESVGLLAEGVLARPLAREEVAPARDGRAGVALGRDVRSQRDG